MENSKTILILLLLLLISSCSLFSPKENLEDGWVYVKEKDYANALKKFRIDYEKYPDSLDIICGMFYIHFLYGKEDSAKKYLEKSFENSKEDDKTLFIGGFYYREKDYDSTNYFYEKYVEKNSPLYDPYIISTTIKSNSFHKIGLSSEYLTKNYQFVYDVLKSITDIPDSLDVNNEADRIKIFEYINGLEELWQK